VLTAQHRRTLGRSIHVPQVSLRDAQRLLRANTIFLLAAALLYFVFLASLSQQPAGSHPDEYGKINQIASGERNWNHPQLLLTNLQIARIFFPRSKKPELVQIGRYISNAYAAATVFLFSIVGWRLFGTLWSWVFFGLFATNSAILVTGRYLKEDIFLLFGMTLLALALTYDSSDPRQSRIAAWIGGLGCAVVLSSKYIGLVFVAVFLVAYFYGRGREWRVDFGRLIWPFLVTMLVINYRLLFGFADFLSGFEFEFDHAVGTHHGVWFGKLSNIYLSMILHAVPLAVPLAIPLFVIVLRLQGCRKSAFALLLFSLVSICIYGALIQWAPIKIPRYAFPLLVMFPFAFLVAAGEVWRSSRSGWVRLLVAIPMIFAGSQSALSSMTIGKAIRDDSRDQLFRYMTTSPQLTNALVLADAYSRLNRRLLAEENPRPNYLEPGSRLSYGRLLRRFESRNDPKKNPNGVRLRMAGFAADACFFGDCDQVDYVVISCTTFNRFFRHDVRLDPTNARRRNLYRRWLKEGDFLKRLGSSDEDFESQFGMYESPCLYVMRKASKVEN
jgi:hypothetical protein